MKYNNALQACGPSKDDQEKVTLPPVRINVIYWENAFIIVFTAICLTLVLFRIQS
jgi:hypothetical protein